MNADEIEACSAQARDFFAERMVLNHRCGIPARVAHRWYQCWAISKGIADTLELPEFCQVMYGCGAGYLWSRGTVLTGVAMRDVLPKLDWCARKPKR